MTEQANQDSYWEMPHVALGEGSTPFDAYAHNDTQFDGVVFWWVWGNFYHEPAKEPGECKGPPVIQLIIRIEDLLDNDIHDYLYGYDRLGINLICDKQEAVDSLIRNIAKIIMYASAKVKYIECGDISEESWDILKSPK